MCFLSALWRFGYVRPDFTLLTLLAVAGAAWGLRSSRDRTTIAIAASALAATLAFTLTSGGDWMEGGRLLVPTVPFLALLVAATWIAMVRRAGPRRLLVATLVAANLTGLVAMARGGWALGFPTGSTGRPLWTIGPLLDDERLEGIAWPDRVNRVHLRDAILTAELERLVDTIFAAEGRPVVVLSTQMGMVPY